jgi:hypothetical protein
VTKREENTPSILISPVINATIKILILDQSILRKASGTVGQIRIRELVLKVRNIVLTTVV